jgi:hypothetical protein
MYDTGKVIIGIIIFILIFTAPLWLNLSGGQAAYKPVLKPVAIGECVESKEYMRAFHMDLLNQWRDSVVRMDFRFLKRNGKAFIIKGEKAEMSLSSACLRCHSDKVNFCDKCHNYLDVKPYCWDCHVDPKEVQP